jgi:hypothetical protein
MNFKDLNIFVIRKTLNALNNLTILNVLIAEKPVLKTVISKRLRITIDPSSLLINSLK